jgi:hypothetical protein
MSFKQRLTIFIVGSDQRRDRTRPGPVEARFRATMIRTVDNIDRRIFAVTGVSIVILYTVAAYHWRGMEAWLESMGA